MKKLYEETAVQDIAAAIREKNGTATKYKVAEMGDAVRRCLNTGWKPKCTHLTSAAQR